MDHNSHEEEEKFCLWLHVQPKVNNREMELDIVQSLHKHLKDPGQDAQTLQAQHNHLILAKFSNDQTEKQPPVLSMHREIVSPNQVGKKSRRRVDVLDEPATFSCSLDSVKALFTVLRVSAFFWLA